MTNGTRFWADEIIIISVRLPSFCGPLQEDEVVDRVVRDGGMDGRRGVCLNLWGLWVQLHSYRQIAVVASCYSSVLPRQWQRM